MFNHILSFEIIKFTGEAKSNGFPPRPVAELKKSTEQNPSSFQRYFVKETKLLECLVHYNCGHECDDYHRYSESVPLLHGKRALQPSTSFHQRAAQSSMVLTF